MAENQRQSFRIGGGSALRAELIHSGRTHPCHLENLSAGGASVTSTLSMQASSHCTLTVHLFGPEEAGNGAVDRASFLMEVLEGTPVAEVDGSFRYRLRNSSPAGSPEYEQGMRLVFEAQRRMLASDSGASEATPMASDEQRREALRTEQTQRFSKRSLRPGTDS